jgi:hypothetical protein
MMHRFGPRLAFAALLLLLTRPLLPAQVNSWTASGNGNWQDLDWSLGLLPGPGQNVSIENAGRKAIAIGPETVTAFPQSLTVQSVTVSSPAASYNTLVLNYIGYAFPFRAATMTINSNSALTLLGSALEVTNTGSSNYRLEIGGTVNQGENSSAQIAFLSLGNVGPGVYNCTNGSVGIGTGFLGGTFHGQFNQFSGSVVPDLLRLTATGEYDLSGGTLGGVVQLWGGMLKQTGGIFQGGLQVVGTYLLQDGLFTGGMQLPASSTDSGAVIQSGGTNQPGTLTVG